VMVAAYWSGALIGFLIGANIGVQALLWWARRRSGK